MKNLYLQIPDLIFSGSPLVLATVVRTNGSTPQKPGSSALFGKAGLITGTVGGGVVEWRVQKMASEALKSKNSSLYLFNLNNDISRAEEAICGGQISVLLDGNLNESLSVFEQLQQSLQNRIPGVLITLITGLDEKKTKTDRYWISKSFTPPIQVKILEKVEMAVEKLISDKNPSGFCELEIGMEGKDPSTLLFLQPVFPPEKLVIAGAGHIGRSLAHLGSRLGFEVTVIDDRSEFANSENIPDADHVIVNEIGKGINDLEKWDDTYVVIVTRGHKDDASALKQCIGKNIGYLGMIGSRNKIAAMRQNFIENGWATEEQWSKIHAPVGLEINSRTVEEIAISIAAELVLVRNGSGQ